jgi:antitoxin (DNA-binding transcriptional repressor) of toxin-antitoxin stability system
MVQEVSMRQVSLREFRTRGSKALKPTTPGETILLAGRNGPEYFLVPVLEDVATQDRELQRAIALASLRRGWQIAKETGADKITDEEIDAEIDAVRTARLRRKKK